MIKLTSIFAALLITSSFASGVNQQKNTRNIRSAALNTLSERITHSGGCNANVCFAIDGSNDLSKQEFTNEQHFVLDVTSVIGVDEPVEFAAVQYSESTSPISPLTNKTFDFIIAVSDTNFRRGNLSFLASGLNYCVNEFRERRGEANKIVLLGQGRSHIGRSPRRIARKFRKEGGSICVVGAGFPDDKELLAIAGDPSQVFTVDNFFDTLNLRDIVDTMVAQICGN